MAQGKGSRARTKLRRDAEKRKRKELNKQRYEHKIGTEANVKRKGGETRVRSAAKHRHLIVNCGNVGCSRCFPRLNVRL